MNDEAQQAGTREANTRLSSEGGSEIMRRLAQGDIGSLPVLLGLVLIALIFQFANRNFLRL